MWFVALMMIGAAAGIGFHIAYFYYRSNHVGSELINQENLKIAQAQKYGPNQPISCTPPPENDNAPQPAGIISISSIGLREAPVVNGTTDAELNVAIGHLPSTVWPGQPGTSILSAHDVTWFSHIPSLNAGDQIIYETPCDTYFFNVTSHEIVSAGTQLPSTPYSSLVLDTCWPINALFLTNHRYLVFAKLASAVPNGMPVTGALRPKSVLQVPASPSLSAAAAFKFPYLPFSLGTLTITGNVSTSWSQSTAPTDAEVAAVTLFADGIYSGVHSNQQWWSSIAPKVTFNSASPLYGASKVTYLDSVNPTINVNGSTVVSFAISTVVYVSGSSASGKYSIEMTATAHNDILTITGFDMVKI